MKYFWSVFFVAFALGLSAQYLVSVSPLNINTAGQLRLYSDSAKYDVQYYRVLYNTTDVDGSSVIASGALAVPFQSDCNNFPLIAYTHGTVLRKSNVPSRENGESLIVKLMASAGMVAVAPDYLGLGDNAGLHPYIHAESEATATVDLIRAAREFLQDSSLITLNGDVFVTGYSQGGHAAMATAKYIQDQNLYSEFNLVAAGPASGPYNMSGSQQQLLLSPQPYSNPGYVVYLLLAYQRVYGNIFTSYDAILKSPYDTLIPPYFNGNYDMSQVNALLPPYISDFIQDSVLTNFKNDSVQKKHPIWQALLANDNYDWNPQIPMELYYCTQDEQVNFSNSLDAEAAMQAYGANVQAVNRGALNHGGCVFPSLSAAIEFYRQRTTACQSTIGLKDQREASLEIFPLPAGEVLKLRGFSGKARLKLYDSQGRLLLQKEVRENEEVDVSRYSSGLYMMNITLGEKVIQRKVLLD